jgi:hypothetical protein
MSLKSETAQLHIEAENHPFNQRMMKGELSDSDYLSWLQCQKELFDAIEKKVDQFAVMPHMALLDAPIFGFDLVGINRPNKFTAAFLDLSGNANQSYFNPDGDFFGEPHRIPNWGDIFSPSFVCIIPDMNKIKSLLSYALGVFLSYFQILAHYKPVKDSSDIVDRQNQYCEVQSQNPKTFGVLKSKIGENDARWFMQNILFPLATPLRE